MMKAIKFFKVEDIPSELEPNSIYLVNRDEENVEIYFSDDAGSELFPLYYPKYTGIGIPNVTRRATPKVVGDIAGTGLTTMGLVNRRLYIIPYLTTRSLTLTSLRLNVGTGQTGTAVSIGIYGNITLFNNDDAPYALLANVSNLSTHLAGDVSAAISFTFKPNTLYWFGVISTGAPSLRCVISQSAGSSLGRTPNSNNAVTHLYKDLSSSVLPAVAPFDLLVGSGSFPAVYLIE